MLAIREIKDIVIDYYNYSQDDTLSTFHQQHALSWLRRIRIAIDEIIVHARHEHYTNKELDLLRETVQEFF